MKKLSIYSSVLLALAMSWGCNKDETYPGGEINPSISIFDIRGLYKGQDVTLSKGNMGGSVRIAGLVVSDHRAGNMPAGVLVVEDGRRLGKIRGITIPLGDDAARYISGDSVHINVEGAVVTKVDGMLQLKGVTNDKVTKVASGRPIPINRGTTAQILANPASFESTLTVMIKGGFFPMPAENATIGGDLSVTDGFGHVTLHTEKSAGFAGASIPLLANYYGVIFNTPVGEDSLTPRMQMRMESDVDVLSNTVVKTSLLISGFASDVKGGDGNYEYIQMVATEDIDFSKTPYCMVVNNNANASTPTGFPTNGWATGGMRTYKINMTSGVVKKGDYCYAGGLYQLINGSGSTAIPASQWVANYDYVAKAGQDFGVKTSGLMANSGNAFGIAIFQGTKVTATSVPIDVLFVSTGGSLYDAGPPEYGYAIANTDFYDINDPIFRTPQQYYRKGLNTLALVYNTADVGYFYKLGGEYSTDLGRWLTARSQNNFTMTKTTTAAELQDSLATKLK
ncbi:DUF5689 domain-containing protein [Chitinophaga sp. sic0106]|uniref:DUF5689 domain-containing protein n=1 Tax=Chitinophaga sp. sic0106 TaxID=2854785 RepID=UPI001C46077C|nr:DUF5689 domain-containing protein [Chitinophaga sp. sic0106]MBV7532994.1 hypothetical protein [Chitinophaga sp. sic0106]